MTDRQAINGPNDDDPLYQAALAVEADEALAAEMAEWEEAMICDGLDCLATGRNCGDCGWTKQECAI